jgi:hypothetical protein
MDTIKLSSPLLIDDETVTEVTYDVNAVTNEEYLAASSRRKGDFTQPTMPVNDMALLFAWGVQAILSANRDKNWTADDFARVKGHDNWQICQIGYSFFSAPHDEQPQESSEVR